MTQPLDVRAHLYRPLVDETGRLYTYATVTVYEPDGNTLYPGTIYRSETTPDTWPNPFIAAPGLVDIYLATAARVVLGIVLTDGGEELRTDPIDVVADAAKMVYSAVPIFISGTMAPGGMLSVDDYGNPFWRTIKIDHEHAMEQPGTLYLGDDHGFSPQDATFPAATVIGSGTGTDVPPAGLTDTTAIGTDAAASGPATTALGVAAAAAERPGWPWTAQSTALGVKAWARSQGVAAGFSADATATGAVVALGREALGGGDGAVVLGTFTQALAGSISVGHNAGSQAWGTPGSIGLGADAQYGLPSTTDPAQFSVLLGAHDPTANVVFPWANPQGSQSESPLDEYLPAMSFAARTVQFQRHLTTVLAGLLVTAGDASFGRSSSTLAFYGATPQPQVTVGDDEPASGIEALDSLIYALRDLGLLRYRHEASVTYSAADMLPHYLDGDDVTAWNEHDGAGRATVPGALASPPSFTTASATFNHRPAVRFANGVIESRYGPREVLVGQNLITSGYHVIAVASHEHNLLGYREGLVNLIQTPAHTPADDIVLQGIPHRSTCWDDAGHTTAYTRDELNQRWNLDAHPDGSAHVYRVSNTAGWPTASLVLGGPADTVDVTLADYWRGSISHVTVLDHTWPEAALDSMTYGLMFREHIDQQDWRLRDPATDFIVRQHEPTSRVKIVPDDADLLDDDAFVGYIGGEVENYEGPCHSVPWVSIWDWFECYEYWGPVVGSWANLPIDYDPPTWWFDWDWDDWQRHRNPLRRYEVIVTTQRKNRIVDIAESEYIHTWCWCEDSGVWSTGCDWTARGFKTAYLRDRRTGAILAQSGFPSTQYDDIEVRGYTNIDGTLVQQDVSAMWGNERFWLCFPVAGPKVIRVYRVSTGEVLASTEWQDRSLPRYTVASSDDPDYTQGLESEARTYDSSVAVMALCEAGPDYYRRARTILSTLVDVMNDDGSINDSYDSLFPAKGVGVYSAKSIVWFGLALMYYQSTTGDSRFYAAVQRVAYWLFNHQHDGLMPRSGTDSSYTTEDNVSAYFFFQRYSEVIAEQSA